MKLAIWESLKAELKNSYSFLLPVLFAIQFSDIVRITSDLGLTAAISHGLHGFRNGGELALYLLTSVLGDIFYLLAFLWIGAKVLGKMLCPGWLIKFQVFYFSALLALIHFIGRIILRHYFKETADFNALRLLVDGNFAAVLGLNKGFVLILISTVILAIGLNIAIAYGVHLNLRKKSQAREPLNLSSIRLLFIVVLFPLLALSTFASYRPDVRFALNQKMSYSILFWPLDKILDFDGDGFGVYGMYRDPDIFSKDRTPYVFPSSAERVVSHEDTTVSLRKEIRKNNQSKNLVLIVLEGMRPDILWKKLDTNWISPHLNDLAKSGSFSRHMYSHTGTTIYSKQAIFFGTAGLVKNHKSLFSELSEKMYQVAVFSCMDETFGNLDRISKMRELSNPLCDAACSGAQPVFHDTSSVNRAIDEGWVYLKFKKYAESQNWSVPHFIYFNLQATHYPYNHSKVPAAINSAPITQAEILNGDAKKLKNTYYNSVHYIDTTIGNIVQTLKDIGQWDNTLLIAVGDHGEALFDDGSLGHGSALDDNQTNTLVVSNLPIISEDELLGLDQIKNLALKGVSGELDSKKPAHSVIQFLGLVDEPIQIASVDEKGARLIIDFRKSRLFDPSTSYWLDLQSVSAGSPLDGARNRLMDGWKELLRTSPSVPVSPSPTGLATQAPF